MNSRSGEKSSRLFEDFFNSNPPDKVGEVFATLLDDLKEKNLPVLGLAPLMSLAGEWAIRELVGRPSSSGDVDWGVVINCPVAQEQSVIDKIFEYGEQAFARKNIKGCLSINPRHYYLNLNFDSLSKLSTLLPDSCHKYREGKPEGYRDVVTATLPLLCGDSLLIDEYREKLKNHVKGDDYGLVWSTLEQCSRWMQSLKGKKVDLPREIRDILNSLKNYETLPANIAECGGRRSYGLIAVKPSGMDNDTSILLGYLLNTDNPDRDSEEYNSVVSSLIGGFGEEERNFFLENIKKVRVSSYFYGDFTSLKHGDSSFWHENYDSRHGTKYWHEDLLKAVDRGTLEAYLIESDLTQDEMDKFLDLLKGRENIVQTISGEQVVLSSGRGLRGLYDTEAVTIGNEDILRVGETIGVEAQNKLKQLVEQSPGGRLLFTKIPKDLAAEFWVTLSQQQKDKMLANSVHANSSIDEVWISVKALLLPVFGEDFFQRVEKTNISLSEKIYLISVVNNYFFAK